MEKTIKPQKQRNWKKSAVHRMQKEMSAGLSKELRAKYSKRSIGIVVGDKVKIVRGSFKGKEGKVEKVNIKKGRVFVEGVQRQKVNGTVAKVGTHPSNMIITSLELKDKMRKDKLTIKEEAKK